MAEVIVSALYLWLAFTAVALVVWIVKRLRANRRATQARQARAVDSLLIGNEANAQSNARSGKTIDVSDDAERPTPSVAAKPAMATAGAPTAEESAETSEPSAESPPKSLGSVIASSVGAPPPRKEPEPEPEPEPATAARPPTAPQPVTEPEQAAEAEPPPVSDDRREAAPPPATTIAELLSGIRLPIDLQPVPPTNAALASSALTFTSDGDPATVGGAFADELERLGYEIYSLSDTDAVARRRADDQADGDRVNTDDRANTDDAANSDERVNTDADTLSMSIRLTDPGLAIDVWVGAGESPFNAG